MNRSCLLRSILGVLLFAIPAGATPPSPPDVWNEGTYEISPPNSDPVGEGDDHFRGLKQEIRERASVEHQWSTSDSAEDNGLHRVGSARCFVRPTAPTAVVVGAYGSGGEASVADLDTAETRGVDCSALGCAGTQLTGHGRCWVDTDDYMFYVYDDTNGWIATGVTLHGNHIYDGSFEASGDGVSSPVWATAVGDGVVDSAQATDSSEGKGYEWTVSSAAGAGGIGQTLVGLKPSTSYLAIARVNPDVASAAVCRLFVDLSGGTDLTVNSTGTGSYETLAGVFTTDATPTGEAVQLLSVGAADICNWDHVGVYEIRGARPIPLPGITANVVRDQTDITLCSVGSCTSQAILTGDTYIAPLEACYMRFSGTLSLRQYWGTAASVSNDANVFNIDLEVDVAGAATWNQAISEVHIDSRMPVISGFASYEDGLIAYPITLTGVLTDLVAGQTYQPRIYFQTVAETLNTDATLVVLGDETGDTGRNTRLTTELICPGS